MYKCLKTDQNRFVSDCIILEQANHTHQNRHHERLIEPLLFSEIDSLYYGDICYAKVLEELYALNYLCSQWHCVFVAVDFE